MSAPAGLGPIVDHADDGTPLHAPRGELPHEADGSAVQCHLCGRWFRQLASSHVIHAHGLSAAEYRALVGLTLRHPFEARTLSEWRADRIRRQIATNPRLRRAMDAGIALARSGALQDQARMTLAERPMALERQRQLAQSGAQLGTVRAAAYRKRREERASALGHQDLEAFYRCRYVDDKARLETLAAELDCAESAVRNDLRRLGLGPDRTRSHGARWAQRM